MYLNRQGEGLSLFLSFIKILTELLWGFLDFFVDLMDNSF